MATDNIAGHTYCEAFDPEDLVILDCYPPAKFDESQHAGESWANVLCNLAPDASDLYAPDYDGTTVGHAVGDGINVLIPRRDIEKWRVAAHAIGAAIVRSDIPVTVGRYGDGAWSGVYLLQDAEGTLYWFDSAI